MDEKKEQLIKFIAELTKEISMNKTRFYYLNTYNEIVTYLDNSKKYNQTPLLLTLIDINTHKSRIVPLFIHLTDMLSYYEELEEYEVCQKIVEFVI